MSETSQGPGWWQASDGRWYPPESHPNHRAVPSAAAAPTGGGFGPPGTPPGYTAPGYAPPTYPSPGPVPPGVPGKTGMSTAAKVLLIVGLVFLLGIGGCVAVASFAVHRISKTTGSIFASNGSCAFVPAGEVAKVLPGNPSLTPLKGFASLAGVALDRRVLSEAPSCLVSPSSGQKGPIARVARLQEAGAHERFTAELTKARGQVVSESSSSSEGGSSDIKVESEGYFDHTVELGDEAFCTTLGLVPMSGVLVRQGDTLVYVSLLPDSGSSDSSGGGSTTGEDNCMLAQKIAKVVLAR